MDDANWFERNPKKTIVSIVLILSLVLLIAAETYLAHLSQFAYDEADGGLRAIRLKERFPNSRRVKYPDNAYLSKTDSLLQKEYIVEVDDDGFIMPSGIHANPDLKLLFLGGSTTECLFVDPELRFTYLVGRLIEDSRRIKVNSYNGGVSGNNTLHSVNALLNKGAPISPNFVLLMHNINDITVLLHHDMYWNRAPLKSPIISIESSRFSVHLVARFIKENTFPHVYRAVRPYLNLGRIFIELDNWLFGDPRAPTELKPRSDSVDVNALAGRYRTALRLFVVVSRVLGTTPVLMTQPSRFVDRDNGVPPGAIDEIEHRFSISYEQFKALHETFNDVIREVAAEEKVLLIDLAEILPQQRLYMYDLVHFNDVGSKLVAESVAKALLQHLPVRH